MVYGSDETIRHFQQLCPLEIPFVGHGHRLSIAIIDDPTPEAARLAARDIGLFNQQGCLSLQTIFLNDPRAFGPLLAEAMAAFENENPRGPLSLSEAGAITNLREETRYLIAQEPDSHTLWESPGSTAWTIIHEDNADLTLSPGNRTVFLRPLPADFNKMKHLSGIGLHPFTKRTDLPSPRIFPLGQTQFPPALWVHDGILPLGSLLTHQTPG
ncbi:MAG: acyl-CoA reductase [Akkermansiaceae bacterium]|nr:acyl-CoA reductase [Akkermansiaceae bacterium]